MFFWTNSINFSSDLIISGLILYYLWTTTSNRLDVNDHEHVNEASKLENTSDRGRNTSNQRSSEVNNDQGNSSHESSTNLNFCRLNGSTEDVSQIQAENYDLDPYPAQNNSTIDDKTECEQDEIDDFSGDEDDHEG